MRRLFLRGVGLVVSVMFCSCGGSSVPPAAAPEPAADAPNPEPAPRSASAGLSAEAESEASDIGASTESPSSEPAPRKKKRVPEPEFTEGMTVDQAARAVPPGLDRINIDPETLAKPLENAQVYAPCRPAGSSFKLRVAVWNGKAVGIDVDSANPTLAACIKDRVKELTWSAKVPSLNTIEYSY